MAEMIPESTGEFPEVPYLEKGDKVLGKDGEVTGAANKQAMALVKRTAYLKEQFAQLVSRGVNLIGKLPDYDSLSELDPATLNSGDAYFIQGELFVWNTATWIGSGSLVGERGITLLGTWPDANELPDRDGLEVGTGYVWRNDLWILLPEPDSWVALNVKGPDGKSAFAIAQDNGFVGTQAEWLATLVGKSAYRIWRDLGNQGSEADFIASLKSTEKGDKGDDGEQGEAATPFHIVARLDEVGQLPRPGVEDEAYYVGSNLYVWATGAEDYVNLGGIRGASNYDIAVSEGFQGTPAQWLETLKSTEPGPASTVPGPKGDAAVPFKVIARVANESDLPTPGVAEEAYFVGTELFVWKDVGDLSEYVNLGEFAGKDNYELAVLEGYDGTRAQWLESLKSTVAGPIGPRGPVINIRGRVASAANLPAIADVYEAGDAIITNDTGNIYVVNDAETQWQNKGQFAALSNYQLWLNAGNEGSLQDFFNTLKGADGDDGTNGTNIVLTGSVNTVQDLPANAPDQAVYSVILTNTLYGRIGGQWMILGSFRGANGNDGADGKSLDVIKVLTEEDQTIPPTAGNAGKAYVDQDGYVYFNVNGGWQLGGRVGIEGNQGEPGIGFRIRGTVPTISNLPPLANIAEGDAYITANTKLIYAKFDGQWSVGFDLTGPQGEKGDTGERGAPGTSINILGQFNDMATLVANVPVGQVGDGYLLGFDDQARRIAVWTSQSGGAWLDAGPALQIKGDKGDKGEDSIVPGPRGMRGASWITLPAGQDAPNAGFAGNVGDWATSDSFKVYHKTANEGWVYWGQLVAGDVNSPPQSAGRVVRYGNEWVKVPVDEVQGPLENVAYVRVLKEGSETETEWAELDLSKFLAEVDSPVGGALYVQKDGTWVVLEQAPNDGKRYVQRGGKWEEFNNYDLPVLAINASGNIDPKVNQVVNVDNNTATAKTLTLANGPANRALTVVITVRGAAGAVIVNPTNPTTLGWNNGTPPSLTGAKTNIILFWTGTEWIGSLGAVVP